MNIAVQISAPTDKHPNYRLFTRIARTHADVRITYISDRTLSDCIIESQNEKLVVLGPKIKNRISSLIWFRFLLPIWLKKNKVDFFVSNNHKCISIKQVRQWIRVDEMKSFKSNYIKKYLSEATCIITPDDYINQKLSILWPDVSKKILCLPPVADSDYLSISTSQQEEVKAALTDGRDFFLLITEAETQENLIKALKAFSFFKKWQQSSMKLVIAAPDIISKSLSKLLETYKFRENIIMANETQIPVLTTSAYAVIFLGNTGMISRQMLNAMKVQTPLIIKKNEHADSYFGEAALLTAVEEKDLSQKMILLYKDETFRKLQIEKAYNLATASNEDAMADKLFSRLVALAKS